MPDKISLKLTVLLLVYNLVMFANFKNNGYASTVGLAALLIALVVLFIYNFRRYVFLEKIIGSNYNFWLGLTVFITLAFALMANFGESQVSRQIMYVNHFLVAVAIGLAFMYFGTLKPNPGWLNRFLGLINRHKFVFLIALAVAVKVGVIINAPSPQIDVFYFLNEGVQEFTAGHNPYTATFTTIHETKVDYYGYLPGTLYLTTPGKIIFGDVRYVYVIAEVLAALIIWRMIRMTGRQEPGARAAGGGLVTKKAGELIPVILLFAPTWLSLERAYVEPLMILFLALFAWLYVKRKRAASAIAWGVLFAIKQYLIIALPLIIWLEIKKWYRILIGLGTTAAIIVPLWLWDRTAMEHDVFFYHYLLPLRRTSLTIYAWIFNRTDGFEIPAAAIAILTIATLIVIMIKQKRSLGGFLFGLNLILLLSFLVNKQAFINYYYFLGGSLLIYIAYLARRLNKESPDN